MDKNIIEQVKLAFRDTRYDSNGDFMGWECPNCGIVEKRKIIGIKSCECCGQMIDFDNPSNRQ